MKRSKAFTLIELLVVVAIIGILAAIAVPNFIDATTRAKIARVQSDFKNLASTFEVYKLDWGKYPGVVHRRVSLGPLFQDGVPNWSRMTSPVAYVSSSNAFTDPFLNSWMHYAEEPKKPYGVERFWYEAGYSHTNPDSRVPNYEWAFGSIGPDVSVQGLGVGTRIIYLKRQEEGYETRHLTGYPYNTLLHQYDVTNGLKSIGDLHYFNTGTPSRYCREINGVKRAKEYELY